MNVETLSRLAEEKINNLNDSLRSFREKELSKFRASGFREVVQDSYKFTNLSTFFSAFNPENVQEDLTIEKSSFPTITFINGELSGKDSMPEGVTVRPIGEEFNLLEKFFKNDSPLSSLHHGLFKNGVLIEVAPGQEISSPVRIVHILTRSGLTLPTFFIDAKMQSKLTVLEETHASSINHSQISETYIVAAKGSSLNHIMIHEEGSQGLNHASVYAEIDQDAAVRSFMVHGSGKLNRSNLVMNLNAPGAHAEAFGLFLTNATEHSDFHTAINHKSADTTSQQMCKGILDDESKGVFTGKIHIFPKAQRVASGQLNRNLLLSRKAQVHSQPQLEIFADDVKCSHGSTTGQLSPEEVFYFQSRGIPEDKARSLLALGFGLEVIEKIPHPEAREHIRSMVMENLKNKFSLGRLS